MARGWWEDATDDTDIENRRGTTRLGQTGWVAWIDNGEGRRVQVHFGRCVEEGAMCQITTDDGEHTVRVPTGRLDHSPVAALTNLSRDLKEAGGREIGIEQTAITTTIKILQDKIDRISRTLLLDLVAVEQAKHGKYTEPKKRRIGQEPQKLEHTPPRIAHDHEQAESGNS